MRLRTEHIGKQVRRSSELAFSEFFLRGIDGDAVWLQSVSGLNYVTLMGLQEWELVEPSCCNPKKPSDEIQEIARTLNTHYLLGREKERGIDAIMQWLNDQAEKGQ